MYRCWHLLLMIALTGGLWCPAQEVLSTTHHDLPYQGLTVIETRTLDPVTGTIHRDARTSDGVPVDLDERIRREIQLSTADRQKMTVDLFRRVAATGRSAPPLHVAFWLTMPDMPDFRLVIEAGMARGLTPEEARCVARDQAEQFFAPRTGSFAAALTARGYEVTHTGIITPVVLARVPAAHVALLASDARVAMAYLASDRAETLLNKAQNTLRTPTVYARGITGKGSSLKVMVNDVDHVAKGNPYLPTVTWVNASGVADYHASAVAGNICSQHGNYIGVAKELPLIYSGAGAADAITPKIWNDAMQLGVSYGNCSWWNLTRGKLYYLDRYFDHIVRNFGVMMFAACGNEGTTPSPTTTTPSNAYNAIASGCYNDKDTPDWTDDRMVDYSSYQNPAEGHDKPEVVSPGDEVTSLTETSPWIAGGFNGTSSASPLTCGLAALLGTRDANLRTRVYTLKAIIMASAWHNLEGDDTLSDKDGVGGIHVAAADAVTRDQQFVDGTLTASSFSGGKKDIPIVLQGGNYVRVCVVWFSNANSSYSTDNLDMDLDLIVLDPNQKVVASSAHTKNPFEIVSFFPTRSGTYTVRLQNQRFSGTSEPFAVAWSDKQDMATCQVSLNGTGAIGTTMQVTFSDRYHSGAICQGVAAFSTLPFFAQIPERHLVPLAPDPLFFAVLNGMFPGFYGTLDGKGNRTASMPIPNLSVLRGLKIYLAMASFRSGSSGPIVKGTSPAVHFTIQ